MMKTLIVYDSVYGNTEKIAKAVHSGFNGEARLLQISDANPSDLISLRLLIMGSPVHGGRATSAIDELIRNLPDHSLKGTSVAVFDTRFSSDDHGFGMRILMNIIRFASERVAKELIKKGGTLIAKPEGFIVEEKAGPLRSGELERAKNWTSNMKKSLKWSEEKGGGKVYELHM